MEVIKANILKAMNEEYTTVHRFVGACYGDTELDESFESKMVQKITNSMDRWADARKEMHKTLSHMISTATDHKKSIENNFSVDSGWINSSRYETNIADAKKYEHELTTLTFFIGFTPSERSELFAKLTSLIQF
jgi:hypothetical protein